MLESQISPETLKIFSGTQSIVLLAAAIALISIWVSTEKREIDKIKDKRKGYDQGLLWFSFSFIAWSVYWIWIFFTGKSEDPNVGEYLRIFSSTINSSFILIAIAYLDYGPLELKWKFVKNHKIWKIVIIGLGCVIGLVTVLLIKNSDDLKVNSLAFKLNFLPDLLLSTITAILLGIYLFKTFYYREFKMTAYFTISIIAFIYFTQFLIVFKQFVDLTSFNKEILLFSSKLPLIFIIFALSSSWIYQKKTYPKTFLYLIGKKQVVERESKNKFPVEIKVQSSND